MVRTDFKARYHHTLGGYLWALAKPVSMFVVLYAVFSFIFGADPDYAGKLVIGLFLWGFFDEATKTAIMALQAKSFLVSKARFPLWVVVITSLANALLTALIFLGVVGVWMAITRTAVGPLHLSLALGYLIAFAAIVAGIGLAGSVLYLKFRDLNQVWDLMTQVGFFLAPVVYPLGILPEWVHFPLYLWPPTPVIEFTRSVLVAGEVPTLKAHLLLGLVTLGSLGVGALVFRLRVYRAVEEL